MRRRAPASFPGHSAMASASPDPDPDPGRDPQPPPADAFAVPGPREILAASAPWLGALLNILPGLGAGYLYQRRWRAWWITTLCAVLAFGVGALPQAPPPAAVPEEPTFAAASLALLLLLAGITAVEAFLAARKARMP